MVVSMKRHKIKSKYLNESDFEKENVFDKIERVIKKSLVTIGLIFLLMFWNSIPVLILSIFQVDYSNMHQTMKVLISFLGDILLLIIFVLIYFETIKRDFKNYFYLHFRESFKQSFSTWLIGFGIMIASNLLIALLTNGQLSNNEEAVRSMIDSYPLYMVFQLIVYAPLTEEIIFRKSIKDIFHHKYVYILVSGFVFGSLHVISSLNHSLGFLYLIPYCSLGFVFAYLYQKTDNIFSTITAHSIHNTLALLIYLRGIK